MFPWGQESVSGPFSVDSSTDDSFISQDLAMQARIPIETMPEPRPVLGLNGKVLVTVTHQTQPLKLIVSGNHQEHIRLLLITVLACFWVLLNPEHN